MASLCTIRTIRDYFLNGEHPPNGIVCPTNEILFPPVAGNSANAKAWTTEAAEVQEDMRILEIFKGLGKEIQPFLIQGRN